MNNWTILRLDRTDSECSRVWPTECLELLLWKYCLKSISKVFAQLQLWAFWFYSSKVGVEIAHFNKNIREFWSKRSASHIGKHWGIWLLSTCLWVLLLYRWNAPVCVAGVHAFQGWQIRFILLVNTNTSVGAVQRTVLSRSLGPHLDYTGKCPVIDWWCLPQDQDESGGLCARCLPA